MMDPLGNVQHNQTTGVATKSRSDKQFSVKDQVVVVYNRRNDKYYLYHWSGEGKKHADDHVSILKDYYKERGYKVKFAVIVQVTSSQKDVLRRERRHTRYVLKSRRDVEKVRQDSVKGPQQTSYVHQPRTLKNLVK